jgi:hypothetical protein
VHTRIAVDLAPASQALGDQHRAHVLSGLFQRIALTPEVLAGGKVERPRPVVASAARELLNKPQKLGGDPAAIERALDIQMASLISREEIGDIALRLAGAKS